VIPTALLCCSVFFVGSRRSPSEPSKHLTTEQLQLQFLFVVIPLISSVMSAAVLANELLLHIIQFCDVPTLKCFYTANRTVRNLIESHQQYISSKIIGRSLVTDEAAAFRPLHYLGLDPLRSLFVTEHRIRTARRLSFVTFKKYQNEVKDRRDIAYGIIDADEDKEDHIRDCLFVGWIILWRLADIASSVIGEELGWNNLKSGGVSTLTRNMDIGRIQSIEKSVRDRQLSYLDTLSNYQARCYSFMHRCVATLFKDRVFNGTSHRSPDRLVGNEYYSLASWLNWFILREGPSFIMKMWSTEAGNEECSDSIVTEWSSRSIEQSSFEYDMAYEVGESLWFGSANDFGMMVWPLPADQMRTVWPIAPVPPPPIFDMKAGKQLL
jgi:hypothetical protein